MIITPQKWFSNPRKKHYFCHIRISGPPVEVGVTMYVLSISSLSEVKMVLKGLRTFFLSLIILFVPSYQFPFYVFRLEVIVQSFDIVVFQKWNIFLLFSLCFPKRHVFEQIIEAHSTRVLNLKAKNKENEGLREFFECESFDGRLHWCGWVCVLFSLDFIQF